MGAIVDFSDINTEDIDQSLMWSHDCNKSIDYECRYALN